MPMTGLLRGLSNRTFVNAEFHTTPCDHCEEHTKAPKVTVPHTLTYSLFDVGSCQSTLPTTTTLSGTNLTPQAPSKSDGRMNELPQLIYNRQPTLPRPIPLTSLFPITSPPPHSKHTPSRSRPSHPPGSHKPAPPDSAAQGPSSPAPRCRSASRGRGRTSRRSRRIRRLGRNRGGCRRLVRRRYISFQLF